MQNFKLRVGLASGQFRVWVLKYSTLLEIFRGFAKIGAIREIKFAKKFCGPSAKINSREKNFFDNKKTNSYVLFISPDNYNNLQHNIN